MKIVVCDDDNTVTKQILSCLRRVPKELHGIPVEAVAYTNGDELLQHESTVDIAFLDVEMDGLSGISVGAELARRNPDIKIIIITSYIEYLDEAFRTRVFRYMVKPLDEARLIKNTKEAIFSNIEDGQTLIVEDEDGVSALRESQIVFFESIKNRTLIYTLTKKIESKKGIEYWRALCSSRRFFSTHRGFIVNMQYVTDYNHYTVTLKDLSGNTYTAGLARSHYAHFKETYLFYNTGETKRL